MNFKTALLCLTLLSQTQGCIKSVSFIVQVPGQPDQGIYLNPDGTICSLSKDNVCDKSYVLCNTAAVSTGPQIFATLEFKSKDECVPGNQPPPISWVPVCTHFRVTNINGKMFLQCFDTTSGNEVTLVGYDGDNKFIEGDPNAQLPAGQNPVTLKPVNDPCMFFLAPVPAPPAPPSGPVAMGGAGSPCAETHACQPGFCCNGAVCAKCPSGPPPPPPIPPKPATVPQPKPTPPKPTPLTVPFHFNSGKEGDECTTVFGCKKGLCCKFVSKGVLKTNTCQKCTTSAPPKPTPPKPSPTAPPDPALASALNPRTLTLFRSMGNDMFAAMKVFSPDNKEKRFLDLSKTNLHFECGKGYVTIFNDTSNGLHKRLNPGPPTQTIRTIRFESYTVKNQIIHLPAQCASDHFYRANSYSYFSNRVQIFYDTDFNGAQSEGVANVHIVYSSGKQLQKEQNLDKAGSGSLWSSLKAWVQEMNTVEVDKSKSISYSNSFNQKLIEITAKCQSETANANFDSSITIGGSFSASITFGFYGKGTLVPPNIEEAYTYSNAQANADIHLDFELLLTGGFQKTVPVIQQAFTPLQIPGLVAIGPKLEMDITVFGKFSISAHGKISASKQFGPYYTAHHFVGSSSNSESDQSPTGSNDIQWTTSIDFQADGDVGIILTPRMFLDAEITAGSKTLVKADTGAYVNLYGALAGHAQAEAIASNSQKSASASACMQVYGGANVGLYLHGQVLNQNKQLNWPLWKVDKTFLKPDSKCPLTTLPQLPTVQFKKRNHIPRRLYKRSGALFNFDASSFACPKIGFKPPPPSKSDGPACSVKPPTSNKKTDFVIDPKQKLTSRQLGKAKACPAKLHKRAQLFYCDLTQMTDQIRKNIREFSTFLGYAESDLQHLNDQELIQHNHENVDFYNYYNSLSQNDAPMFFRAYKSEHASYIGDGHLVVSFEAIKKKAQAKIKDANQIVSSIDHNPKVTVKALYPNFLLCLHSLYITDMVMQSYDIQRHEKRDPITNRKFQITFFNMGEIGSLSNKIMDLFLTAKNDLFYASSQMKNPYFKFPHNRFITS